MYINDDIIKGVRVIEACETGVDAERCIGKL